MRTGLRPTSLTLRVRTRTGTRSYLAVVRRMHPYGVAADGKRAVHPKARKSSGNDMTRTPAARMERGCTGQRCTGRFPRYSRLPLTLQPWNGEMAAREEKGHKGTWQQRSCGPSASLRPLAALRDAVGRHSRQVPPLASLAGPSVAALPLAMPSAALEWRTPPPAPPHLSTGGRRGKGCSQAVDHLALRTRFVRGGRPVGRPAARPSRSSSRHGSPVGRQASGAGTGAGPYIESPRTPGGTCTRCPTPASRETEEASS